LLADHFPGYGITVSVVHFDVVRRFPKIFRPAVYLALLLRRGRSADVILALDPVSTGFPAAIAAMLLRKPLVAKIVGDRAWEHGHQFHGITASPDEFVRRKRVPLSVEIYRQLQQWVAGRAKRIIVPSTHLKGIISAWGMPAEKIEVIYNSVHPGRAGSLPDIVKNIRGFRIVTIARLIALKNIDAVIKAVDRVSGAHLIIVGDGPERANLEALANNKTGIVFTGALRNEDAVAVLASADVMVLNSSHEGLSHVLIEALMAGVPIVATRTGGNPEILADESGILVPVGDTVALARELQRLNEDPELRTRLGKAARARAEAFSLATMLERTKTILASVQSHG
jgi:glycosyltransferase involved in cell wall biosynthesis